MKCRKLLSWILTTCLVFTVLPLSAVCASAAEIIVDIPSDPDPTIDVDVPGDPDPTIIVDIPDDPDPVIIIGTDLYGSGTANNPYVVYTTKGMQRIAEMFAQGNDFRGNYICLGEDIDLSSVCSADNPWTIIGTENRPFAGSFDGRGHTISGLYAAGEATRKGLFGVVTGTVRNLTVDGKVLGSSNTGGIAGENRGIIETCTFKGDVVAGTDASHIGGIAGLNQGAIRNCTHKGTIIAMTSSRVGGIAGTMKRGSVTGCINSGNVNGGSAGTREYFGGIIGFYEGGALSDCRSEGSVSGVDHVGGIVGGLTDGLKLSGFVNTGSVSGTKGNVGGIAGSAGYGADITSCRNDGTVKGSVNVGGIVGRAESIKVFDCVNNGNIGLGGITNGTKGGIAGYAGVYTQIKYCANNGDIIAGLYGEDDGLEDHFGGIAGYADNANGICYCYNTGSIACRIDGGGIVGHSYHSPVTNCFNIGKVYCNIGAEERGGWNFGGIVGYFGDGDSLRPFIDCYNTGAISGRENVGGIVGGFACGVFDNCVSIGSVNGNIKAGALIGWLGDEEERIELSCNYYYNPSAVSGGVGNFTDEELGAEAVKAISFEDYQRNPLGTVFAGFDFRNTWYMTPDGPRLQNMVRSSDQGVVTISSVDDLKRFRDNCNAGVYYKDLTVQLVTDLDLSGNGNWIPIGSSQFGQTGLFSGTFDGRGHTVSGMKVNSDSIFSGFFGAVDGTVKNLMVNGRVNGNLYTGGIAGQLLGGTIEDCSFEGSVEGLSDVGGIAGRVCPGTLRRCIARGSVEATSNLGEGDFCNAGGVAGYLSEGSIMEECMAGSDVTGLKATGGIVGSSELSAILNCLHTGSVNASGSGTGGVAGVASVSTGSGSKAYIRNCYHFGGMVESGETMLVGGIVGNLLNTTDGGYGVYNCYYQTGTVKDALSETNVDRGIGLNSPAILQDCNPAGAAEPLTEAEFQNSANFVDWDFHTVWYMDDDRPVLQSAGIVPIREIRYQDAAGETKTAENCIGLKAGVSALHTGWYFVEGNIVTNTRIEIDGSVNLILKEGACLNANKGIHLTDGNNLTIWGETQTSGKIRVTDADESCAGIGGNAGEDGGYLTVNSGEVDSRGGMYGAGIGGGDEGCGCVVTVNGGSVSAYGNEGSAGIGGGDYGNGGELTVTGGSVTAVGSVRIQGNKGTGQASPGIGAGRPRASGEEPRDAGYVTVSGGTVTAIAGTPQNGAAGAQAIGVNLADAEQNGNGSEDRIVLKGSLRARGGGSEENAVTVSAENRVAACHGPYVRIEACLMHIPSEADKSTCAYCGATGLSIEADRIVEDFAEQLSETPSKEEIDDVVETIRKSNGPDELAEAMEDESVVEDLAKIEKIYSDVNSIDAGVDVRTDELGKDLKNALGDGKDTVSGVGVSLNADEGQSVDLVIGKPGPKVTEVVSNVVHKAIQFSADVKNRDTGESVADENGLKVPVKVEMAVPDYFRQERIRVTDSSGRTVDVTLTKGDDGKTYAGFVLTDPADITMEQQNIEAKQTGDGVDLTAIISDEDLEGAEKLAYTFYDEDGRMIAAGVYDTAKRSETLKLNCDGEIVKDVKILRIGNDFTPKAEGIAVEVE